MTRGLHIRPRSGTGLESGAALLAARGLSPDLLRQASRRLEMASLALGAAFAFALALNSAVRAVGWFALPHPTAHSAIAILMIAVSALVVWLARGGRLPPQRLLDAGLVYEVVVAAGISAGDHITPLSAERPLADVSWLCVWIVLFPLVVPATPVKTLLASLAAATTWAVAFYVGVALGHPSPPQRMIFLNLLENYIAAVLALVPAVIVRRLGAEVEKARAMGSYELVERLDRGGMGEVWRARHRMLARPAAIKLIRPDSLGAAEGKVAESLLRRFEREARATAELQSPHSIELYDFGVTPDGTFYYVMEILDGLDLESLVARFGPVAAERAIYLLLQACDSLADAHHLGLIHRDVKPANLYVCRKGLKHDFLKVLDFGLVASRWALQETRLTREGTAGGTPAYMAPEVALGASAVDARVDIYGLGCVAYWLLTGHLVFEGDTPVQMALQHVQTPPVPPSSRTETPIPPSLDRLVLDCLEKDPEKRPGSAQELARRLAACEIPAPWTHERAKRWWDAHLPAAGPPTSQP